MCRWQVGRFTGVKDLSTSPSVRTRHPKSVTRATILQKAYELYLSRDLVHGDERLSVVLSHLGYTTGAGYQIWANQAAFRDELQVFIAENIEYATLSAMGDEIKQLHDRNLPFEQQVLAGADMYVANFLGREDFYLSLRFYAMAERPHEITEAVIQGYERLTWQTSDLFENVLASHGRRMKSGVTTLDLSVASTALAEGYALRQRIQPDKIRQDVEFLGGQHHAFSIAFLGMVKEFTEEIGS